MGTWKIPGSTEVNQTDHLLVSARHASSIIDVRNSRGANCDSDHYLVKAKVRERISRSWKYRAGCGRRKWNSELITSPEGKMRYQASLQKKLEGTKMIESGSLDMIKEEARRRMLQKETQGSYEKYKELQKEVKKFCKKKRKENLQKQLR